MTDVDLSEFASPAGGYARDAVAHPRGYEPGYEWDGRAGWIVAPPSSTPSSPEFDSLLREWGFDPERHVISGPIQHRRWQQKPGSDWLYYYRANIVLRGEEGPDLEPLLDEIRRHKVRARKPVTDGDRALWACWADLQLGKPDGDGTAGTVRRALDAIDLVLDRAAELRKTGRKIDTLVTPSLGDIVESCDGHYSTQAYGVELNMRDQMNVARRLFVKATTTWAQRFDRVIVPVVGGNHGENRKAKKAFTDLADNFDVAVWEQVADVLGANPDAYGHVEFRIPHANLDLTVNVHDTTVAMLHGHQFAKGSGPSQKAWEWWRGQMEGMRPAGGADILLNGHNHHLLITRRGIRTHLQAPALDGGSDWWRNSYGLEAPPGMLTFTTANGDWADLAVLS